MSIIILFYLWALAPIVFFLGLLYIIIKSSRNIKRHDYCKKEGKDLLNHQT